MKRYLILLMCLLALSCTDKLAELEIVEFGAQVYEEYEKANSNCALCFTWNCADMGIYTSNTGSYCTW